MAPFGRSSRPSPFRTPPLPCTARGQRPKAQSTATARVEVFEGGTLLADASAETTFELYPDGDICIWKPPAPGVYRLTLHPTVRGNPNVLFTVRDHVPGNWCTTPPELNLEPSGAIRIRWLEGDDPIVMYVYYPADGVCLSGGAGGDFLPIGNPASLYLVAEGTVTVEPWEEPEP